MANLILLKKSSVAAKVPTTGDLDYGELALNYADGALYYKTSGNAIARLNPPESIGFANVAVSGQSTLVADTATGTLTVAAGNGAITVTTNSGTDTLTISHADTSSVANLSSDNSAGVVLQDIAFTFDTYGHVQTATVATTNLDTRYLQTESDTLATVTTRGATTTNAITVGGLTVNGNATITGDVDGVDSLTFDTTATEANAVGKLYWNAADGTLSFGLVGGNSINHIGQHLTNYVYNADTTTITKGEVVYLFGAHGDRASVKKASNASEATSSKTLGVASENIAPGAVGFVVSHGVVDGLSLGAYNPGDLVYLGSTPGTITATLPIAPNHTVFVGVIARANNGNGQLFVKVNNGLQIDELHDIQISGLANNDSLFYNSSTFVWQNTSPTNARTKLGLGTIATQNANSVAITGGAIDGTTVGATTPSTGKFTTLQTTGSVTIAGDLTVSGTTTTVSAQNLSIADNLIYLNDGSTNSNPDLGFVANYNDGTYRHAGFFRDATDGYWKVFKNYTPEPDASIYIDTSHVSFALADIQAANFRGALVGNATTASTLAGTPTINGVTFNGGSNITITANTTNALTIGAGLSGTSFNGSAAVTITVDNTVARVNDTLYVGTTAIALNRTSAAQTLTGINGLTAVGTNQSITLTPTGTGGVGIGTSSPNELLSIGYIDGSYGRIEFRSASYARQAIIEGVDDASGGNGHLAIYTRNSGSVFERLRVASSGNIGVGTTNPVEKFHLDAGSGLPMRLVSSAYSGTEYHNTNGTWKVYVGTENGGGGARYNSADSQHTFYNNGTGVVRIASTGNVGIGSLTPGQLLTVGSNFTPYSTSQLSINSGGNGTYAAAYGNNSAGLYLTNQYRTWVVGAGAASGSDKFEIYDGGNYAYRIVINNGGDIGIGTTSPGQIVEASRSQDTDTAIKVTNANTGASATAQFFASNGTNQTQFYHTGTAYGGVGAITANQGGIYTTSAAGLAIVANNAAGLIKFVTGGTAEKVRIDASGNVGIGTTSPSQKLDVSGNIALSTGGYIYGDTTTPYLRLNQTNGTFLGYSANSVLSLLGSVTTLSAGSNYLGLITNGSERMRITNTGNVGIGATAPSSTLEIRSSSNARLTINRSGAWAGSPADIKFNTDDAGTDYWTFGMVADSTNNIRLKYNASEYLTILTSGNVGIGTASPSEKLAVSGGNISLTYNSNNPNVRVIDGTIITKLQSQSVGDTAGAIGTESNHTLKLITGNSARVTIDTGGSVGIGVSPSYTLDVAGTFRTDRSSTGTVARLQASGITAGQQANLFLGKSDTNNNEATFVWHHVGDGSTSNYLGIGAYGTDDVLNVFAGNRVGVATTASVGNTTLTASLGIAAYSNTAGVSPYLQTYNGNATLNEKTWRMGGQANGKFQIETVNDAYSAASAKIIITQAGNVGIGVDPTQALHVSGNARITGAIYDSANSAGTNGQVLTSTGTGTAWSSTGAAVTGTGTTGKIAKWSATTALADSVITESSGNIGIDTTPTQKLDVNGNIGWNTDYVLSSSTITTTTTTANQVITSVAATSFRTFKFIIQATDATAGKYQSQEILAVHNGSTVAHTEYTAINVGGAVATYDVDISGSTVRLLCTPLSANSTVFKVSMQLIKV